MERLNLAILNQATTSGACPPSHHAHPPAAAGSFFHPFPAISLINGFGRSPRTIDHGVVGR